jgi:hypothetical protein
MFLLQVAALSNSRSQLTREITGLDGLLDRMAASQQAADYTATPPTAAALVEEALHMVAQVRGVEASGKQKEHRSLKYSWHGFLS